MIHFASLYCVELDPDLRGHWTRHYLARNFDSYTVFLNTQSDNRDLLFETQDFFGDAGFCVRIATGPFGSGALRDSVLSEYASMLASNDFLVTADSDEFQAVPADAYGRYDVTNGGLRDCYADRLVPALDTQPLETQYPHRGNIEAKVKEALGDDCSRTWYPVTQKKICCARAGYDIDYQGSHRFRKKTGVQHVEPVDADPQIYNVDHYTWRPGVLDRILSRAYNSPATAWYIWKFFGGQGTDYPPGLAKAIAAQDARNTPAWK